VPPPHQPSLHLETLINERPGGSQRKISPPPAEELQARIHELRRRRGADSRGGDPGARSHQEAAVALGLTRELRREERLAVEKGPRRPLENPELEHSTSRPPSPGKDLARGQVLEAARLLTQEQHEPPRPPLSHHDPHPGARVGDAHGKIEIAAPRLPGNLEECRRWRGGDELALVDAHLSPPGGETPKSRSVEEHGVVPDVRRVGSPGESAHGPVHPRLEPQELRPRGIHPGRRPDADPGQAVGPRPHQPVSRPDESGDDPFFLLGEQPSSIVFPGKRILSLGRRSPRLEDKRQEDGQDENPGMRSAVARGGAFHTTIMQCGARRA
jgi:hypothetical protein